MTVNVETEHRSTGTTVPVSQKLANQQGVTQALSQLKMLRIILPLS